MNQFHIRIMAIGIIIALKRESNILFIAEKKKHWMLRKK